MRYMFFLYTFQSSSVCILELFSLYLSMSLSNILIKIWCVLFKQFYNKEFYIDRIQFVIGIGTFSRSFFSNALCLIIRALFNIFTESIFKSNERQFVRKIHCFNVHTFNIYSLFFCCLISKIHKVLTV